MIYTFDLTTHNHNLDNNTFDIIVIIIFEGLCYRP